MWKRIVPASALCGMAALVAFLATHSHAYPPRDGEPAAAAKEAEATAPAPTPGVKPAPSRVTAVTVYPNSALITREVEVPQGAGTLELIVTPLPPTVVNSSL